MADGSPDQIVGIVKVREILAEMVAGREVSIRNMAIKAEVVPDQLDAMDALRVLQSADIAMAVVHDEYGHFEGIVTPVDLLTAIAGDFASDSDQGDAPKVHPDRTLKWRNRSGLAVSISAFHNQPQAGPCRRV